jgi:hypothetical protein
VLYQLSYVGVPSLQGQGPLIVADPRRAEMRTPRPPRVSAMTVPRPSALHRVGETVPMFFFFSNGLGCLGSLLVSAVATLLLLLILGVINLG